jgi:hypothetical protein
MALTIFLSIRADPSAAVFMKLSVIFYNFMMLPKHNDNLANKVKGSGPRI